MTEFRIFLKQALFHWPLLVLLIVLQLALGQISAVALSDKAPDLSIALVSKSDEPLAARLITTLMGIDGLEVIVLPSETDHSDVFAKHDVQGLVEIPPRFDEYMQEGRDRALVFYPAPGVTDPSVALEFLSTAALLLRADIITEEAVTELGVRDYAGQSGNFKDIPILVLEYEGPPIKGTTYLAPPAFGVPAVFLLLAFLHAALIIPGRDNRRLLQSSMQKTARVCIISLASLLLVWVSLVLIYGLWMFVFYDTAVPVQTMLSLAGIAVYACTFGGILSITGKRTWGVWIFIFWILFNLTVGGGLWGSGITNPLMIPLLPVSAVVSFVSGDMIIGMLAVIVSFAVCFAVYCGIAKKLFARESAQG